MRSASFELPLSFYFGFVRQFGLVTPAECKRMQVMRTKFENARRLASSIIPTLFLPLSIVVSSLFSSIVIPSLVLSAIVLRSIGVFLAPVFIVSPRFLLSPKLALSPAPIRPVFISHLSELLSSIVSLFAALLVILVLSLKFLTLEIVSHMFISLRRLSFDLVSSLLNFLVTLEIHSVFVFLLVLFLVTFFATLVFLSISWPAVFLLSFDPCRFGLFGQSLLLLYQPNRLWRTTFVQQFQLLRIDAVRMLRYLVVLAVVDPDRFAAQFDFVQIIHRQNG